MNRKTITQIKPSSQSTTRSTYFGLLLIESVSAEHCCDGLERCCQRKHELLKLVLVLPCCRHNHTYISQQLKQLQTFRPSRRMI